MRKNWGGILDLSPFPILIPFSDTGRVTEYLLQFNQPQSVQERRWLIEAGRYPSEPAVSAKPG
jgi:hypothetical protein